MFSDITKNILCKVCVLFSNKYGGRGRKELQSLVATSFINWKKGKQTFDRHSNADYYILSVEKD